MTTPRNLLRLKRLKFVSLVDRPANEHSLAIVKRAGEPDEVNATCRVVKVDEKLGIVLGFANVSLVDGAPWVDSQGDATSESELVKIAAEYAEAGAAVDEMHDEQPVDGAKTVFLFPLTSDIATSLGIGDIEKTGILIGVKVPPTMLAKFTGANGAAPEYTGFSIGGTGTREPLEKRDTAAEDAALAKHRAELDAQLAKQLADKVYEERVVKESHAWLDEIAGKHGIEFAKQQAEVNRNSIGKWGQTWLDKHTEAPAETVEKAAEQFDTFMKSAEDAYEKSLGDFNAQLATYSKANAGKDITHFIVTPEGRAAYQKQAEAREQRIYGRRDAVVKSYAGKIDALQADIDKSEEAFAMQHAMDIPAAREQLAKSSPSHLAKKAQLADLYGERSVALMKSQHEAEQWHAQQAQKRNSAAVVKAEADRLAKMMPAERKLEEHCQKVAKERGIQKERALVELLEQKDPTAIALYELQVEERNRRMYGRA